MHCVSLNENQILPVELRGMAALQWRFTSELTVPNPRIVRYMSDVLTGRAVTQTTWGLVGLTVAVLRAKH